MFATAGFTWFAVTQSTPAITPLVVPLPLQSRTRTAYSVTLLATPHVVPPTVPATCVPWPLQSSAVPAARDRIVAGHRTTAEVVVRPPDAGIDDVRVHARARLVVRVAVVSGRAR
jgi:hypothetical protein